MSEKIIFLKPPNIRKTLQQANLSWSGVYIVTLFTTLIYIFMEWLYIITKPSFITSKGINSELGLLANTILFALGFESIILSLAMILSSLQGPKLIKNQIIMLVCTLPSFLAAALSLLLFDNFSYTVLGFGIITSQSYLRLVYAILFFALILVWFGKVFQYVQDISIWISKRTDQGKIINSLRNSIILVVLLMFVSIAINARSKTEKNLQNLTLKPNILLITGDGINAKNMSVYGYERKTTPNIDTLASTSLVAENAFTNSSSTQGSIISILTGKYPTQTRVLYPPNILKGQDAFQHLPGILQANGYYSIQISFPYYVDASSANLLNGFDVTNQKAAEATNVVISFSKIMRPENAFFIFEVYTRIIERIQHIFFIKKLTNPFDQILQPPDRYGDIDKVKSLIKLLNESDKPLFVQMHLMDTHGPTFSPNIVRYSNNSIRQGFWNEDFYDDAILNFDNNIGLIIEALNNKKLLNNSIIIVGSDHGQQWSSIERIPLILRFPNGEFSGKISSNVQNIDIAPTILDYLGLQKPIWMEGHSLLGIIQYDRPIFSSGLYGVETDPLMGIIIKEHENRPPYFQFGKVGLIKCDNWYQLNLVEFRLESGKVYGSTSICEDGGLNSQKEALNLLITHLNNKGFDTTNLLEKTQKN